MALLTLETLTCILTTSIVKLTRLLYLVKQNFIILVQAKSFLTISLKGFFVFMMAGKENT